jgi:uncharacterized protein (DUF58 family)
VRLRPTAAASYLLFFLICIYGGAVHYQSNAAYLVLALSAACALVSGVHARRNLDGLTLTAGAQPPALAGDPLLGTLTVRSGAQGVASIVVALPEAGPGAIATVEQLAAASCVELAFTLPPRARGDYRITRVRLATTFPLGLFRAWIELPLPLPLHWLVYPRPLPAGGEEPRDDQPEDASARELSGAGDFRGHRSWVAGDPQRHVDWRAAARGGPLLVKQYGGGPQASRALSWEEAGRGDVEERLARLAGRVLVAEQAGVAYALSLPGRSLSAANGHAHFHDCMGALARFAG